MINQFFYTDFIFVNHLNRFYIIELDSTIKTHLCRILCDCIIWWERICYVPGLSKNFSYYNLVCSNYCIYRWQLKRDNKCLRIMYNICNQFDLCHLILYAIIATNKVTAKYPPSFLYLWWCGGSGVYKL